MKSQFAVTLLLLTGALFARGQAAPSATTGSADLRYALRYSENVESGGALGDWNTINASGSLDYSNGRSGWPFTLDYTGGYRYTVSGPSYSTGPFQHLLLSQGFSRPKWFLNFDDDASYRRQAPITGFSGIPGTGEPITGGVNPPSSQLILTVNTPVVNNDASGRLQHIFNHFLSISADAHHGLLRYIEGNGLDTDQLMVGAGPSFRLNARNSLIAHYGFSQFSYSGSNIEIQTHTATLGYDKRWNRAFQSSASAGPEWVQATGSISPMLEVAAQASLTYQARHYAANLFYNRGANSGSGYLMGAISDSAGASLTRLFSKTLSLEMTGGYRRTSELSGKTNIAGEFGSVQASWEINRHLNAFANYTGTSQSSTAQVPSNVLNEFLQVVSFGINFSKNLKSGR